MTSSELAVALVETLGVGLGAGVIWALVVDFLTEV
jgi:hypothetical protein